LEAIGIAIELDAELIRGGTNVVLSFTRQGGVDEDLEDLGNLGRRFGAVVEKKVDEGIVIVVVGFNSLMTSVVFV
jgi:hypothetical protein